MADKSLFLKNLADGAENKLKEIVDITNEQFDCVDNDNYEKLDILTEKRGKIIEEFNLISAEADKFFSEYGNEEAVKNAEKSYRDMVTKLKNDVFEANKRLEKIVKLEMEACKNDINTISKNKEALRGYGNLDYPTESAFFDKKNC